VVASRIVRSPSCRPGSEVKATTVITQLLLLMSNDPSQFEFAK